MTLKSQLLNRLKEDGDWIHKGSLQRMEFRNNRGATFMPDTVSREMRRLYEEMPNRVEREKQGKSIAYRYIKSNYEKLHDSLNNS